MNLEPRAHDLAMQLEALATKQVFPGDKQNAPTFFSIAISLKRIADMMEGKTA